MASFNTAPASAQADCSKLQILPLAEFKPVSPSRAWASVPNPNGLPLIATATSEKTVRVYSLSNFTLHSTLEGGHTRSVRSVAWKPTLKNSGVLSLATGSFDATMGIWRRREQITVGAELEEKERIRNEDGLDETLEIEITSDGALHSGQADNSDDSDGEDWEFAIVLEGHDSEVKSVSYSPSGQWLASCSRDKSIWIWEEIGEEGEDEFETVAVLQEHDADVKFICWRGSDDTSGEVLASASYDDSIRLWREDGDGEWSCFAVLEGHEGTVWSLDWEPEVSLQKFNTRPDNKSEGTESVPKTRALATQRLISSSTDCTIRVWSLAPSPLPSNKPSYLNSTGIPSTMRSTATETWMCTATLPKVHDFPIYSICWSKKSGRIVSTGGDGKIVVYEERRTTPESYLFNGSGKKETHAETEWVVLSTSEGAHGPYEINHVSWCTRFDNGTRETGEEMIVTTGDDGVVRAWALDERMLHTGAIDVSEALSVTEVIAAKHEVKA